jgi:hypothetical protein
MKPIDINHINARLLRDIDFDTEGWTLYECEDFAAQIVVARWGRAGIVFIGRSADGQTFWTDATSPVEAWARFVADSGVH